MMLGRTKRSPEQIAALKGWATELLPIPADATLTVAELECHEEGCPPIETVIAALVQGASPRQWKLHKSLPEVTRDDIVALAERSRNPQIREWRHPD
ncbi:MAG: hypothetical protein FJ295_20640 [Planctomycetes bacterium]|nr:hypothetical protein [Planctomycetota bacterium]